MGSLQLNKLPPVIPAKAGIQETVAQALKSGFPGQARE